MTQPGQAEAQSIVVLGAGSWGTALAIQLARAGHGTTLWGRAEDRPDLLAEHGLTMSLIDDVIERLQPLDGALGFLDELRSITQVIILSDTFEQFARPFMRQLGWPTLFCHKLETDADGMIVDYHLRQADPKRKAVQAFHGLNFRVIATGDSYNDTSMLGEADAGILFCPPQNVIDEFPQFPVATTYAELQAEFSKASSRDI